MNAVGHDSLVFKSSLSMYEHAFSQLRIMLLKIFSFHLFQVKNIFCLSSTAHVLKLPVCFQGFQENFFPPKILNIYKKKSNSEMSKHRVNIHHAFYLLFKKEEGKKKDERKYTLHFIPSMGTETK